jgi:osmotically-inducible protein OsmY
MIAADCARHKSTKDPESLLTTASTTKIKAVLFDEPNRKPGKINAETFKGVVQLSGFVNSLADTSSSRHCR